MEVEQGANPVTAPAKILQTLMSQWGRFWESPFMISRPGLGPLPLLGQPKRWFLHQIRDARRRQRWNEVVHLSTGRPPGLDMTGFRIVDLAATAALHRDQAEKNCRLTPYQKGLLVSIVSGSFWLCSRLHKAGLRADGICPHCMRGVQESKAHVFWQCTR